MHYFKKSNNDRANMTPLHLAAAHGDRGTVEQLLHEGNNPNQLNKAGVPPLFSVLKLPISATPDQILDREEIFWLLWSNTSPDIRLGLDESGGTVLHLIAAHGFDRLAYKILEEEPQLSSIARRFHNQDYPIHTALLNGQYTVAKVLFDLDSQTSNYLNAHEQLPLHVAAQCGSKAIWMLCCDRINGDDINQVDIDGHTALALLSGRFTLTAEERRNFEQYIIEKGARTSEILNRGL
jgi:ankyrin repeat protein